MTDSSLDLRHKLALKFSVAICILLALGFVVRLFVATDYPIVIVIALVNVGLALFLHRMISGARYPHLEAPLLLAISVWTLVPLLLITGGVNSQLTSLLICCPIIAALLGGRKLPFIVFAVVTILILGMYAFNDLIVDISGEQISGYKALARAVWLIMGVLISTGVGVVFQQSYLELTHRLDEQATMDHLTGLLNRRGLEDRLDEELQRQKRTNTSLALLMLDVDNFKHFNDEYGHAAGDRCLVALAKCLGENTRGEDLLARFGGEEFLVVLINVAPEQAALAAEKLRQSCALIKLPGIVEPVSVTIGYVCVEAAQTVSREALIKFADDALYRGKLNGRNQVTSAGVVGSAA